MECIITWRDFDNACFRKDSVISEEINYDLVMALHGISNGKGHFPDLMDKHDITANICKDEDLPDYCYEGEDLPDYTSRDVTDKTSNNISFPDVIVNEPGSMN